MGRYIDGVIKFLVENYETTDPFALCTDFGIKIRYADFEGQPHGLCIDLLGVTYIIISEKVRGTPQQNFVCAHELFHALEHSEMYAYYFATNAARGKLETDANIFAAKICASISSRYEEESIYHYAERIGIPKKCIHLLEAGKI